MGTHTILTPKHQEPKKTLKFHTKREYLIKREYKI